MWFQNLSACDTALGMDLDGAACGAKPNCAYDAGMSDINYGQPVFASMVVVFSLLVSTHAITTTVGLGFRGWF